MYNPWEEDDIEVCCCECGKVIKDTVYVNEFDEPFCDYCVAEMDDIPSDWWKTVNPYDFAKGREEQMCYEAMERNAEDSYYARMCG